MKSKILLVIMSVFLVGTAISQDVKVTEQINVKEFIPPEQFVADQSARSKFLMLNMGCYPVVNGYIEFVTKKYNSDEIEHTVEFYADKNKNIRLHVAIIGPEYELYSSSLYSVKANTYYGWWVKWNKIWKTGVYKVTFMIEVTGGTGGATLVTSYSHIIY